MAEPSGLAGDRAVQQAADQAASPAAGPPGGLLPAVYDVDALATASVAAATLAVAELGARRLWTGVPEVEIDRFAAATAFRSERLIRPLGWRLPPIWDP